MTDTFAAHIITADATTLGDPEILIMTTDHGVGARLVERHELGAAESLQDCGHLANDYGWRLTGEPTTVETGYVVVPVERV